MHAVRSMVLDPDEPALVKGNLAPLWKTFVPEVRAVGTPPTQQIDDAGDGAGGDHCT